MSILLIQIRDAIVYAMLGIMILFILGVFLQRIISKQGIGERIIQLTCMVMLICAIVILSMEDVLKNETVATLLGAIGGYVLASLGKKD